MNLLILDKITKKRTAFGSFTELTCAIGGYCPSIYIGYKDPEAQIELWLLAHAYDKAQADAGDDRRAYRGDFSSSVEKMKSVFLCLENISTRDDKGEHFMEKWRGYDLFMLESCGCIEIERPIHEVSGQMFPSNFWKVEVTARGKAYAELWNEIKP